MEREIVDKFINPHQVGGIQQYAIDNGEGRGVRVCEVNTGSGLRYRVLVDRGLDIDHAFMREHSIAFLTHKGVAPPNRAMDRGADWLKTFPGGLLTSCGPFNTGGPARDQEKDWGLHGEHSNTAAEIESVVQPDPLAGRHEMSVTGTMRYGAFYGHNVTLRRTIKSALGVARIDIDDTFTNDGNHPADHAWLLHINFGYPLLDAGTEFVCDVKSHAPRSDEMSQAYFTSIEKGRKFPAPSRDQHADRHVFRYVEPNARRSPRVRVGLWNAKLKLGVAIEYAKREFPRLGQWMHWGEREYVSAIEPMTAGVEGRDQDRQRGWLRTIRPRETLQYRYSIEVVANRSDILGA